MIYVNKAHLFVAPNISDRVTKVIRNNLLPEYLDPELKHKPLENCGCAACATANVRDKSTVRLTPDQYDDLNARIKSLEQKCALKDTALADAYSRISEIESRNTALLSRIHQLEQGNIDALIEAYGNGSMMHQLIIANQSQEITFNDLTIARNEIAMLKNIIAEYESDKPTADDDSKVIVTETKLDPSNTAILSKFNADLKKTLASLNYDAKNTRALDDWEIGVLIYFEENHEAIPGEIHLANGFIVTIVRYDEIEGTFTNLNGRIIDLDKIEYYLALPETMQQIFR